LCGDGGDPHIVLATDHRTEQIERDTETNIASEQPTCSQTFAQFLKTATTLGTLVDSHLSTKRKQKKGGVSKNHARVFAIMHRAGIKVCELPFTYDIKQQPDETDAEFKHRRISEGKKLSGFIKGLKKKGKGGQKENPRGKKIARDDLGSPNKSEDMDTTLGELRGESKETARKRPRIGSPVNRYRLSLRIRGL